ncbi:MAG: DUF2279 domain-containing protein [Saprospiraceae bacterium]|nr:DUF2279 domain-containing protein [Saprospiraceae bacterium]
MAGYFRYIIMITLMAIVSQIHGQKISFFTPADTFHKTRFYTSLGISAATYTVFSVGLYNAWYKDQSTGKFRLFNDWGEWRHMDKVGHVYSAYFQAALCYKSARWTGLNKKGSMITGLMCGGLFQTTLEVMDGFSDKWGFSVPDIGANFLGLGIFAAQQHWWDEQRIYIKVSSIPIRYGETTVISSNGKETTTLKERAMDLYGNNILELYLKDYNAQAYWLSFNVHSFLPEGNRWPSWLNIALGYGAENMYGGYQNQWVGRASDFQLNTNEYPRYSQFYLGFDADFQKIRTKNKTVNTLLTMFNVFKVPSPALEINTLGQIKFHLFR